MKQFIHTILFSFFFFLSLATFARGGGGSGGGGGGGGGGGFGGGSYHSSRNSPYYYSPMSQTEKTIYYTILSIVFGSPICYFLYAIIIQKKYSLRFDKIENLLPKLGEKDELWDEAKLKDVTLYAFERVQIAWEARDIELIKDIITPKLYASYSAKFQWMKNVCEVNIIPYYKINDVEFVEIKDFLENNKDQFTAVVYGGINDYTINEHTNTIIENTTKQYYSFSDSYHFLRKNNQWLLDDIGVDKTAFDFTGSKIIVEE